MIEHDKPRQVIFGRSPRVGIKTVEEFQEYIEDSKRVEKVEPTEKFDIVEHVAELARRRQEYIYNMNA